MKRNEGSLRDHWDKIKRTKSPNQEMTRVNVNILGISEVKWTGMLILTQMTITSTIVGRIPSEEME